MPRAWRLSRSPDRAWTFSGEGARLYPGRWNAEGVPVVYASEHLSLAALETLVHVTATQLRVRHFSFRIEIPDDAVEVVSVDVLPPDWDAPDGSPSTQALGAAWARARRSVALSLPSAVVRSERNLILNPAHPRFGEVVIGDPEPYEFDPRLLEAGQKSKRRR